MDPYSFYSYLQKKGLERRRSQEDMLRLVQEVIDEGGVKLIEAPTGTGKTFAYLIPIIASGSRAVISTGTKILQDQLRRDIEFLTGHYRLLTGKEVKYAVLKGKSNYLCIDRYKKEGLKAEERGDLPELMQTEWDGDLTQSSIRPEIAQRINVEEDYCTRAYREVCPYRGECYYWEKVKRRERTAQILVINHSMLALKELDSTEEKVLVIDEAHELDRYLTLASTVGVSLYGLKDLVSSLEKALGREIDLKPENFFRERFENLFGEEAQEIALDTLAPYMPEFRSRVLTPLKALSEELKDRLREEVEAFLEGRLMVSFRLKSFLERTFLVPREVIDRFRSGYEEPDEEERRLIDRVKRIDYVDRKIRNLSTFVRLCEEGSERGYKVSRSWSRRLQAFNYRMEIFPLFPRDVIDPDAFRGVILTSATIDPEDLRLTAGVEGEFHRLSHNFDYSRVTFIVMDTNPKRVGWEGKLRESLETLKSLHRKVLVLLTNRSHLKLFEGVDGAVLQGEAGLTSLLRMFQENGASVLVGLDSLWTGIDVRGEKGILMSKLPFDSPEDPVTYHRIKYLKESGEDPFRYQRRKAFIKFRQGVGRLMRQKTDSGTIVLCDNRIFRYREFVSFLRELGVNLLYEKSLRSRRTSGRPY